jgi:hypothetical protein
MGVFRLRNIYSKIYIWMIKEIPKSDVVVRPFKVHKEWTLDQNDIYPLFALSGSAGSFDDENEEKTHGIPKISLFSSIKAQFYNNSATASIFTEVGRRTSYASHTDRVLGTEAAILVAPQSKYGEGMKVGSVVLRDTSTGITYTDDGSSNLIDSASNHKGNIFYDRGMVILTEDIVSGSTLSTFYLDYRSTQTIYENEIFLSVLENEFNVSQNPSAVDWNADRTFGKIKLHSITSSLDPTKTGGFADFEYSSSMDPTGSYLAPYITTIGLYDDDLNMVAVAKLPQPIKSLPDYPINFIIRFDT